MSKWTKWNDICSGVYSMPLVKYAGFKITQMGMAFTRKIKPLARSMKNLTNGRLNFQPSQMKNLKQTHAHVSVSDLCGRDTCHENKFPQTGEKIDITSAREVSHT